MLEEDRALGVDVEREAGGRPNAVRPSKACWQRGSPVDRLGHRVQLNALGVLVETPWLVTA